jgi:hypothetical protein
MEWFVVIAFFVLGCALVKCTDQLRKSLEYDSSIIQSLLAEIRDKLDNRNNGKQ